MAGQCINTTKILILSIVGFYFLAVLQGCACSFGWGHNAISKKGYLPQRNWEDSTRYYDGMKQFGINHPELKLNSIDLKEYHINIGDSSQLFEKIICPTCLDGYTCICLHNWYLIAKEKQMVFNIGLYTGGFAIVDVYLKRGRETKHISQYDLCDMRRKDRDKLYEEITDCFETEILPVMKPYFLK